MIFEIKKTTPAKQGDKRVRTKFAWFPVELHDGKYLWMERYKQLQELKLHSHSYGRFVRRYYHTLDWTGIKNTRITEDPESLYDIEQAEKLREMNAQGRFTLQQFIDDPNCLFVSAEDYSDPIDK